MWKERFKQKIKQLGLRYEDAAKEIGMSKNGFQAAMDNGTFAFSRMILLADKYDFSLDELRFPEEDKKVNEVTEKYHNLEKSHKHDYNKTIPLHFYEDIKFAYENTQKVYNSHISSLKEQIISLKEQNLFLQQIIDKNETDKDNDNDFQGGKSA